jgi:hypothetical protein
MDDTRSSMGSFEAETKLSVTIAVKGDAEIGKGLDSRRRRFDNRPHDLRLAEPIARGDCILEMQLRLVIPAKGCRHAALRPGAGCLLAKTSF